MVEQGRGRKGLDDTGAENTARWQEHERQATSGVDRARPMIVWQVSSGMRVVVCTSVARSSSVEVKMQGGRKLVLLSPRLLSEYALGANTLLLGILERIKHVALWKNRDRTACRRKPSARRVSSEAPDQVDAI